MNGGAHHLRRTPSPWIKHRPRITAEEGELYRPALVVIFLYVHTPADSFLVSVLVDGVGAAAGGREGGTSERASESVMV